MTAFIIMAITVSINKVLDVKPLVSFIIRKYAKSLTNIWNCWKKEVRTKTFKRLNAQQNVATFQQPKTVFLFQVLIHWAIKTAYGGSLKIINPFNWILSHIIISSLMFHILSQMDNKDDWHFYRWLRNSPLTPPPPPTTRVFSPQSSS